MYKRQQLVSLKNKLYVAEQIDSVKQKYKEKDANGPKTQNDSPQNTVKTTEEKTTRQKIFICWVSLSIVSIMSSIGSFLRAIGAVYQLIYHKIPESCLYVTEKGLLVQSPLDDSCLRFIDYFILFFNFLPLFIYSLVLVIYMLGVWYYKLCLLNFFNYSNHSQYQSGSEIGNKLVMNSSVKNLGRPYKILIEVQAPEQCHVTIHEDQAIGNSR